MTIKDSDWQWWLEEIENRGVNLSTWEIDFIESVTLQIKGGREISERQIGIIERIYTERVP